MGATGHHRYSCQATGMLILLDTLVQCATSTTTRDNVIMNDQLNTIRVRLYHHFDGGRGAGDN